MNLDASPTPEQVKQARLKAGLKLREAADLLGLANEQVWNKYENGTRTMDPRSYALFLLLTGQHPSLHLAEGAGPLAAR